MPPSRPPAFRTSDWTPAIDDRDKPVYRAIADAIAADIRAGRLKEGDRLPPQRSLADRLGIDFTTVSRGYGEARHRGLVDARVGQGTFVRAAVEEQPPTARAVAPATLPVPASDSGLEGTGLKGRVVVNMTMNQPPRPAAPDLAERMRRGVEAATAVFGLPDLLRYPEAADTAEDRAAAVHWLRDRLPDLAPERVLVTPGTQGAVLALLTALARPGDTVCAEALTYPGFRAAAAQLGLRVVGVPMDADGLDPDALRAALAEHRPKALYCIPTFHNPTTATMPLDRRRAVVAAAREFGVPIIEDDIYGPLPEQGLPPLAALAPDITFHVAGLAKCVSPALRIAYVAAPDAQQARRVATAQRATTLLAAPLSAAIARHWIADGTADAVRDAIREEAMARRALAESLLPAARVATRREAFHLWVTLPDGWTGGEFTAQLRSRGVLAVSADAFTTTPDVPPALRFCLGAPTGRAETRRALEILADTLTLLPTTAGIII